MEIEKLEIKTPNLKAQKEFYGITLSLEIQNENANSFEVIIGSSVLKLAEDNTATPYHIAFHIPPEGINEALNWIKERMEIQKNGNDEIVDFSAWNAESLYFYDADKNILEFISRSHLYPKANQDFSEKSILGIAEIGLVTNNIKQNFKALNETIGLEKYDGNFDNFCAIGDDKGLIIIIDKNKKDWFPTNDKAFVSDFSMTISHNDQSYNLNFEKDQLAIDMVHQ